jgi:hypothetical protein
MKSAPSINATATVHVVTVTGLRRASMPTTVGGDHAIAVLQEEQHLRVAVVSQKGPAMAETIG